MSGRLGRQVAVKLRPDMTLFRSFARPFAGRQRHRRLIGHPVVQDPEQPPQPPRSRAGQSTNSISPPPNKPVRTLPSSARAFLRPGAGSPHSGHAAPRNDLGLVDPSPGWAPIREASTKTGPGSCPAPQPARSRDGPRRHSQRTRAAFPSRRAGFLLPGFRASQRSGSALCSTPRMRPPLAPCTRTTVSSSASVAAGSR